MHRLYNTNTTLPEMQRCKDVASHLRRLHHLRHRRRRQLGPEDSVPESAGNTEAVLVVHEVVLEVILLQLAVVEREATGIRSA